MSIESMAIALNHSEASGTAKVVLLGIASHDGDGGAWPSIARLARYANVDVRNVQRAITKLEKLGEVRVATQDGGTAATPDHTRPNRYDVLLRCPYTCDGTSQHRTRRSLDGLDPYPPAQASPPGAGVTPPPAQASPELSNNHPTTNRDSYKTHSVSARATVQPAPHIPRYVPDPPRPAVTPRTPAEDEQVAALEAEPCTAAPNFSHWFPGTLTECARGCNTTITQET